ncbi:adipocyte plasma membrane-associated protein isoform X3 [Salmo trutta]|uniref:adipocyte plasma membrane-associated protein isoform X3 n=1 Tax=Salmo trutta TaxID=8032 RepID=UPI00113267E4|nr:adipocyte plasma membrane-associated protein-like isoform X3 [Salmo trutta]
MLGKRAILVVLLSVAVWIYFLPSPIDPQPYTFKGPPPLLEGPLAVNTRLQNGRRLFTGQLHGPESFTADQEGNVYTGTVDGKLWRIHQETLTLIAHMGQDLQECGAAGVQFAFLNGLEISSQTGIIYFTDSSSRWGRRHVKLEVIETNALGRLLTFDPASGRVGVLLDGLYMPNGIALSPDESFLLLAETSIGCVLRYWLKGPKAGTKEVILNNMPGYPDNIRLSDRGTFLVGLTTTRFRKLVPPFLDLIGPYPAVKRFLAKVVPLSWYNMLLPRYGLVLELDAEGEVVGSLHDPTGSLTWAVSDVFAHQGRLYLGSTDLPFLPVLEDWS